MTPVSITSIEDLHRLFVAHVCQDSSNSVAFASGLVQYASCLFMCTLLPRDVYRAVIQQYEHLLAYPSPLGITEQFAGNLVKYSRGTFRETYIRPFRELVMTQHKKLVPFDYHISYDITDPYVDKGTHHMLSIDALMIDYVQDTLTLGELSVLSLLVHERSEVVTWACNILPIYLYARNGDNDNVRNIYAYINAHILRHDKIHIETMHDLRHETCQNHGYRWVTDLPYRYSPDMRPHHLKELIEYAHDGYVFGDPYDVSNIKQTCGIYKRKVKKETVSIFDSLG